jgi:hypothetical protein
MFTDRREGESVTQGPREPVIDQVVRQVMSNAGIANGVE